MICVKKSAPIYRTRDHRALDRDSAMQGVRKRMETLTPNSLDGLAIKKIVRLDGFKFVFQDDSWLGVRLSGTEPVVRLYLEADTTQKKLNELEKIGTKLIKN